MHVISFRAIFHHIVETLQHDRAFATTRSHRLSTRIDAIPAPAKFNFILSMVVPLPESTEANVGARC